MKDEQSILHLLFQTTRTITKEMNETLRPHDLYMAQWSILYYLHRYGEQSQISIAQHLHVEPPTVTRTITRMEKSGWVQRVDGRDKRERIVRLTEEAVQRYEIIAKDVTKMEHRLFEQMTAEERTQLYRKLLQLQVKDD